MGEEVTTPMTETQAVESAATEAPVSDASNDVQSADTSEAPKAESQRDIFRKRFGSRYSDVNMDDDDARYQKMNELMDEYEGYEAGTEKMRSSIEKSPMFAEMILAARDQDEFNPIEWLVREKGMDIQEMMDDPDYADKVAKAHSDYLEKKAKSSEIDKNVEENMPKSIEACNARAEKLGISQEQASEVVGQMFKVMEDLMNGTIEPDIFEQFVKGMNYDTAVKTAEEEGHAKGLNTKVTDKLRDMSAQRERVAGRQMAQQEKPQQPRRRNMFMAEDY